MKKYLAVYLGTAASFEKWKTMSEEERKTNEKTGMVAWKKWMTDNEKSIVDDGAPLGKTKRIDKGGVTDTKNEMGAYIVIEAESHDAAAKLFLDHPHFTLFPGESIEVMECMPMPKM